MDEVGEEFEENHVEIAKELFLFFFWVGAVDQGDDVVPFAIGDLLFERFFELSDLIKRLGVGVEEIADVFFLDLIGFGEFIVGFDEALIGGLFLDMGFGDDALGGLEAFDLAKDDDDEGDDGQQQESGDNRPGEEDGLLPFYAADLFAFDKGEDGAYLDFPLSCAVEDGVADGDLYIGAGVADVAFFVEQLGEVKDGRGFFGGGLDIGDGGADEQDDGGIGLAVIDIDIAEGGGCDGQLVEAEVRAAEQLPEYGLRVGAIA